MTISACTNVDTCREVRLTAWFFSASIDYQDTPKSASKLPKSFPRPCRTFFFLSPLSLAFISIGSSFIFRLLDSECVLRNQTWRLWRVDRDGFCGETQDKLSKALLRLGELSFWRNSWIQRISGRRYCRGCAPSLDVLLFRKSLAAFEEKSVLKGPDKALRYNQHLNFRLKTHT
jgi:hypothetical protein